jgi:hypothetical protein
LKQIFIVQTYTNLDQRVNKINRKSEKRSLNQKNLSIKRFKSDQIWIELSINQDTQALPRIEIGRIFIDQIDTNLDQRVNRMNIYEEWKEISELKEPINQEI